MYQVNIEKVKELKDGRTLKAISEKTDIALSYISCIFTGKNKCKKTTAMCLVNLKEPEATVGSKKMENALDYYFTREEN